VIVHPSQVGRRVLLVLPLAAIAIAAIGLIAVSPSAAGAGREFRYPDNLPVFGGIIFATPSLLFGLITLTKVWRRTSVAVLVAPRRTLLGLLPLSMAIALIAAYALLMGDPDSYRGEFNPVQWRWEPMFPQSTFVQVSIFIAIGYPMGVLGAGVWFLYCQGIAVYGLAEPETPDPIGEIARTGGAFPTR
jgi:hypothetical protein